LYLKEEKLPTENNTELLFFCASQYYGRVKRNNIKYKTVW